MLVDEIKCEHCGSTAQRSLARIRYPEDKNATNSEPVSIVFEIDCPNCGKSQVTAPFPPAA